MHDVAEKDVWRLTYGFKCEVKMFSVRRHWEPLTLIAMFRLKIRIRWIQVIGVRDTSGVRGKKAYMTLFA